MLAQCTRRRLAFLAVVLLLTAGPLLYLDEAHLLVVLAGWWGLWSAAWWGLRAWRTHLVALACFLPLVVLTGEAVFRFYYFGPEGLSFDRYRPAGYAYPWSAFELDPQSYTGLKPHQQVLFKGGLYTVNHHGFRGRDLPWTKAAGVYRLVVTGASATLGTGVADDEALFARLEVLLNEALPDREVQIVNLAMGGATMGNMLHALRHVGMAYEPDLILFFVDHGGLREDPAEERWLQVRRVDKPWWRLVAEPQYAFFTGRFFFLQAAQRHARQWRGDIRRKWIPVRRFRASDRLSPVVAQQRLDTALDRLQELAGDTPVALYMLRPYGRSEFGDGLDSFDDYLRATAAERGMAMLPLELAQELPYARHELVLYPGDPHPNALLHRLYAESFFEALLSLIAPSPGADG